ncbi:hypothetical protein BDW02DRAFT_353516 [Decorospora gaudefroyi]|uniref:Uncharacterized protein n=1 Tax=Decorospora gaudefroyi TaxID=184978 RepID=A0A6A5K8C9_9PLEO|nr:hypothetical protein BDW02DRAFT_353516 [Decorospora gaudefroyi]
MLTTRTTQNTKSRQFLWYQSKSQVTTQENIYHSRLRVHLFSLCQQKIANPAMSLTSVSTPLHSNRHIDPDLPATQVKTQAALFLPTHMNKKRVAVLRSQNRTSRYHTIHFRHIRAGYQHLSKHHITT